MVRLERRAFALEGGADIGEAFDLFGDAGPLLVDVIGRGVGDALRLMAGGFGRGLLVVGLDPQGLGLGFDLFGDAGRFVASGLGSGGHLDHQLLGFATGIGHRLVDGRRRHRQEAGGHLGRLAVSLEDGELRVEAGDLDFEFAFSHRALVVLAGRSVHGHDLHSPCPSRRDLRSLYRSVLREIESGDSRCG